MLLRETRDRLTADLREHYGVRLSDMYAGREDVLEVADMALNLPRGCRVFEWFGGWGAISAVNESLGRLEHLLKVQLVQASGRRRSVPEPEPPKSVRDAERRAKDKQDRLARARADAVAYRGM